MSIVLHIGACTIRWFTQRRGGCGLNSEGSGSFHRSTLLMAYDCIASAVAGIRGEPGWPNASGALGRGQSDHCAARLARFQPRTQSVRATGITGANPAVGFVLSTHEYSGSCVKPGASRRAAKARIGAGHIATCPNAKGGRRAPCNCGVKL